MVICLILLLGVQTVPAFAESISGVAASINSSKQVTVSGTIGGGAGRVVNVRITDPEGDVEYVGSTVSATYGSFIFSYAMTNNSAGRYAVTISALGVSTPVSTYFDYGTNNSLSALSISQGTFDRVFSPDITQYFVTVDSRVTSLTVTPTVGDGTSIVKVNSTVVASGSLSSPIALNTGTNTISVAVTALNGNTKTYSITVTKQNALSASLTANASINADKQVIVSGTVSSGAGQIVSMRISAPDNSLEYAGVTTSGSGGGFQFTYNMSNTLKGRYNVSVGAVGVAAPTAVYHYDLQNCPTACWRNGQG